MTKLFDDRVPMNEQYKYDGVKGGSEWKKRVRDYMIGSCPAIMTMLNWAESMDNAKITDEAMTEFSGSWMGEEDPRILGGHVWKFVRMCLVPGSRAEKRFRSVKPELNGFEAWRALCWDISQGRSLRMVTLRDQVNAPPAIRTYADISNALNEYDIVMSEFEDCGGVLPSDYELKQALRKALPQELREGLLWLSTEPGTFEEFKDMIRLKSAEVMHCRGQTPAHALEDRVQTANLVDDFDLVDHNGGQMSDEAREEVLAFVRDRFNGRFKPKMQGQQQLNRSGGQRAQQGTRPPRTTTRDPKCSNCGGPHWIEKCTKPRLPAEQRACFKCGKPGHQSRNCTDPRFVSAKSMEPEAEAVANFCLEPELCVACVDDEGCTKVTGLRGHCPRPRRTTLGDVMVQAFSKTTSKPRTQRVGKGCAET